MNLTIVEKDNNEFEITRPHNTGRLYNFLINYKFVEAFKISPFTVKGLSVLDVCCGSGMISEYYAGSGAKVTGIDLSEEAIKRANTRKERYEFEANFITGDVTKLPFPDNSFDMVSVHDGLHHIREPGKAIKEMARVAKKSVIIIEPAKALGTKISIAFGISKKYEGEDFVYRFTGKELESWLKEGGVNKIMSGRYIMYYPHKPGTIFKFLSLPVVFTISKLGFHLVNALFGKFGNKIQVIGLKQ